MGRLWYRRAELYAIDPSGNIVPISVDEMGRLEVNPTTPILLPEDGGAQILVDMSVTAAPPSGTEESYSFNLDGTVIAKVYAQADGAGGIKNKKFQVAADLDVQDGNISTSGKLTVSGTGNSSIAGNLGIGTTTPGAKLDVAGDFALGSWGKTVATYNLLNTTLTSLDTEKTLLSQALTVKAGELVMIWATLQHTQVGSGTSLYLKLYRDTTLLESTARYTDYSYPNDTLPLVFIDSPSAGSYTYRLAAVGTYFSSQSARMVILHLKVR